MTQILILKKNTLYIRLLKIISLLENKRFMRFHSVFFLLLFCSFTSSPEFKLEGEIPGNFKFFTTDKLGNVFALTSKNDIQKFDKKGKKITEANFKVMGDATLIDAGNPLEIYVFYKDQNKLVYFDNMLNYRGETDLYNTLSVNNIQAVCRSYDNGFWFFDPDNFKLKKADKQGTLQSASINLANLADTILTPQMLLDDGKFVYLKTKSDQILVFDILANYIKTISLERFTSFQIKDENIIYSTLSDLYSYTPSTFEKQSLLYHKEVFSHTKYNAIRVENSTLYLQDSTKIGIYSF